MVDLQYHRQPFNDDEEYEEDKDSDDNHRVQASDREGGTDTQLSPVNMEEF